MLLNLALLLSVLKIMKLKISIVFNLPSWCFLFICQVRFVHVRKFAKYNSLSAKIPDRAPFQALTEQNFSDLKIVVAKF